MASHDKEVVVGFPLYHDVTLLDFVGATQVFAFSGGFKPIWLAHSLAPVNTSEGVSVNPGYTFRSHPKIDLLFVPGGGGAGIAHAMLDQEIQDFIKKTALTAQWSGSVCVGAFIIAAAGLLNRCKATTYWSLLEVLDRFPDIKVNTNKYPRYKLDLKKKRFSGGGVSSSMDLALKLVKMIKGKGVAQMANLSIQYHPEPPVKAGDPGQADCNLVDKARSNQEKAFIAPIAETTDRVISELY